MRAKTQAILATMALCLALASFQAPQASAMMITQGSPLADPAGVCKRFYLDWRCFR